MNKPKVAYQGEAGANSHMACEAVLPDHEPIGCMTFDEAFAAVVKGEAALAMIPIENAIAGRVSDIHRLLPESGLHIIQEHFQPIRFCLAGVKGARLGGVKTVVSHPMALDQIHRFTESHGLRQEKTADTAGAAREVAELGDASKAAACSRRAAEIHGLEVLADDIQDHDWNVTRFIILAPQPTDIELGEGDVITSLMFRVRNVPAALYKGLGGFATNAVNMTKLESYQLDGSFEASQFYAEVEAHPDERRLQLALDELGFFSSRVDVLGVYPAHPFRKRGQSH